MGVKIESAAALRELAQSFGIEIDNPDDLQDLLLIANCSETAPELAARVLEARERRKEQERQFAHQERMRELELRYRTPVRAEDKAKRAPAWVAFLAPVGLVGVALAATAILLRSGVTEWVLAAILGIIWGTSALIAIALLFLSYASPHAEKFFGLAKRSAVTSYDTDDLSCQELCETAITAGYDDSHSVQR